MKAIHRLFVICAAVLLLILAFNYLYPLRHVDLIKRYSADYGIDPALVCAIINTESGFRADARSHKGASGLMQIIRGTSDWAAEEIGIEGYSYERIMEPELNIRIGCWYIATLVGQFGDMDTAIAAYNAGSGNVAKWLGDERYSRDGYHIDSIPFGETENYLRKVSSGLLVYGFLLNIGFR
jgi:soluble lytic murein transglycosylase